MSRQSHSKHGSQDLGFSDTLETQNNVHNPSVRFKEPYESLRHVERANIMATNQNSFIPLEMVFMMKRSKNCEEANHTPHVHPRARGLLSCCAKCDLNESIMRTQDQGWVFVNRLSMHAGTHPSIFGSVMMGPAAHIMARRCLSNVRATLKSVGQIKHITMGWMPKVQMPKDNENDVPLNRPWRKRLAERPACI
ncbi:hypothetical protein VNO77_37664 [Canavalia gladiata]|uniref:Uncharacterized protein n=1 Tax=Canavalia gladiata TaxID=3824 RepID=A0AAN9KCA9_CANGL